VDQTVELVRHWAAQGIAGEWGDLPDIQPAVIIEVLEAEGVLPLVFEALNERGASMPPEGISGNLIDRLRTRYQLAAVRDLMQETSLKERLPALAGNGVASLLIKGAGLCRWLYPKSFLRPRSDIDVLISPEMVDRAIQHFLGAGYQVTPTCLGRYMTHQFSAWKQNAADKLVTFDVHRAASNSLLIAEALPNHLLNTGSIPVDGLPGVSRLGAWQSLALACLHLAAGREHPRLIWLYDIFLLVKTLSQDEVREFWRWASETEMLQVCVYFVRLALDYFPVKLDHHDWGSLYASFGDKPIELSAILLNTSVSYNDLRRLDLKSLPSLSQKLGYVSEFLFPPVAYMRERYGLERQGAAALAAAYIKRLFGNNLTAG